jgi:hypothetical protein
MEIRRSVGRVGTRARIRSSESSAMAISLFTQIVIRPSITARDGVPWKGICLGSHDDEFDKLLHSTLSSFTSPRARSIPPGGAGEPFDNPLVARPLQGSVRSLFLGYAGHWTFLCASVTPNASPWTT